MSARALSIRIHRSLMEHITFYYRETLFNPPRRVWLEAKKRLSVLSDLDVCLCKRLSSNEPSEQTLRNCWNNKKSEKYVGHTAALLSLQRGGTSFAGAGCSKAQRTTTTGLEQSRLHSINNGHSKERI
jgi:hypothetical protein